MRIRYGKPIKAKSLLGKQNTFSTISSIEGGYYYGAKIDGGFLGGWNGILRQSANSKWISFAANHKYLCYVGLNATNVYKNVYNGVSFLTSDSILRGDPDDNKYGLGYSVTCITPASNISAIPAIQNYNNYWTVGDIVKEMVVLDLTDICGAGNEPTATQFYDKYNQYFPLIAAGEEITVDDKAGQIQLKKLLPDEYQEVEYVESPDNQYIDTGKTVDSSCVISFDFQYVSITNKYNRIFGARNSNGNALLNMRTTNESGGNFYLESGGSPWADTAVDTNKHSIVMDSPANTMTFDGVKKLLSSFYIADNTEGTMWIFGTNQGGSNSNVRFFNYKLIKNGVLEQNLIPCYNKYTGDIGFYDLRGGGKNLCFRPTLSKYGFSKDYLVYNGDNAVYLEAGTYTLSFVSDPGVYIQAWNPNDTSANVLATTAFVNCSVPSGSVGAVWNDKGLNVDSKGPLTFTLTNNYIITICGRVSAENYADTNVQIEKGTAATAYEHSAFYVNNGTGKFLKGPNVSNAISCKVAGGSSDIYYGYNNLCMPLVQDYFYSEYNTEPTAARTYDESSNSTTYTASGGNKSFRLLSTDKNILSVVEGHHYYVRAKMSWNCQNAVITKMGNLNVLASPGFNIVDSGKPVTNNAYFENIHISKRTGSARWVWSPIIDSGAVQDGDTFTTSDFEIIDLTDWFGPGKEPSTVEEFKEKFAKEYYGACLTPIRLTNKMIEATPIYGYNQGLCEGDVESSTDLGVTISRNGYVATINGTMQNSSYNWIHLTNNRVYYLGGTRSAISYFNGRSDHKFFLGGMPSNTPSGVYMGFIDSWEETRRDTGSGVILNGYPLSYCQLGIRIPVGTTLANFKVIPVVIDLTEWYGPGNEPTTVEEFKQTFPNKYYPYSKKTLLNKYMINGLGNN